MASALVSSMTMASVAPAVRRTRTQAKSAKVAPKQAFSARATYAGKALAAGKAVRMSAAHQVVSVQAAGKGKGDLEMVTLKDGDNVAEVYTFGGVCTSWKCNGKDVLYVRPDAVFDKSKPISGGIPHCWPQFGPGDIQLHGFARNSQWELTSESANSCTMTLTPNEISKGMWDKDFKVTQTITLKDGSLVAAMEVNNPGNEAFEFTGSFHTYFAADIDAVSVGGLNGLEVLNRLTNETSTISGDVTVTGPIDSVYAGVKTNPLTLAVGGGRTVAIGYEGWPDAVVWSPWTDMEACYKEFVCVENAACSPVSVAAGGKWSGSMTLSCTDA